MSAPSPATEPPPWPSKPGVLEVTVRLAVVALLLGALLVAVLRTPLPGSPYPPDTRRVALDLLSTYGFPLVLIGLILAVAMMAGVALAKEDPEPAAHPVHGVETREARAPEEERP